MEISNPNSLSKNPTALIIAIYELRLQQRGPGFSAIFLRLSAVIRLLNLHSTLESGVDLLKTLTKMPVPIAAPQAP